jgi:ArsR family transcriptional regulator
MCSIEEQEAMAALAVLEDNEAGIDAEEAGARAPVCSTNCVHEESVALAGSAMLRPAEADRVAALFKVFADPTRVRILSALAASELCVCDLGVVLGMTQSATSHQLALLKAARLVRSRREGKVVFYSLDDSHVRMLLDLGAGHSREAGLPR